VRPEERHSNAARNGVVVVRSTGWHRYRRTARTSNALLVRGMLERADGVINLSADRLSPLTVPIRSASRDFR
jgi:error-prone DNA polymerase